MTGSRTETAKLEALKPCPFCGSPAKMTTDTFEHWVECSKLGVCIANGALKHGGCTYIEDAIRLWNTRAIPRPAVKRLEWHDDTEGPGCPIRFASWPLHGYRIHLYQWGEADSWAVKFGTANGVFLPKKCDAETAKEAVQDEWSNYLHRSALTKEKQDG